MEGRITLTDVMRGIKKHRLADRLADGVYKFLVELILEANELGFKNPIDLTVKQALAIGGGESRQSLYNRRNSLKKIMLDGKHLVKVRVGSYGQKSLATYEIDYKLLTSLNGAWQGIEPLTSNPFDESLTEPLRSLDVPLDDGLPILRSDQIRGDKKAPPNPPTKFTTTNGLEVTEEELVGGGVASLKPDQGIEPGTNEKVNTIQQRILQKYSSQLVNAPGYGACNDLLREFGGELDWILCGINTAPAALKTQTPTGALNLVRSVALRLRDDGNGGTAKTDNTALIAEYRDNLAEVEAAQAADKVHPEDYDSTIAVVKSDILKLETENG